MRLEPIGDRATFLRLRRSGRRARRGPVTVSWVPGEADDGPRVAYAVGRQVGGAVVRNRVRRRLRAATLERRAVLAPGAYLVGATPASASTPYRDLSSALSDALAAATAGATGRPQGPS